MEKPELDVEQLSLVLQQLVTALRTSSSIGEMSPSAASALRRLQRDGALRVTDLARAENVSQPAMTQLVTRLEGEGFASRAMAADDRRAVVVSLTAAGARALNERHVKHLAELRRHTARLDSAERARIAAALPALEHLAGISWHTD